MTVTFSKQFGELNEEDISHFERSQGIDLPTLYRQFLLVQNGGVPSPSVFSVSEWPGEAAVMNIFWGLNENRKDLKYWRKELARDLPPEWLAIGDDLGGNVVVLALVGNHVGSIWYWDPTPDYEDEMDGKTLYKIADSIDEFLSGLRTEY